LILFFDFRHQRRPRGRRIGPLVLFEARCPALRAAMPLCRSRFLDR
jgi:hypothetical protein